MRNYSCEWCRYLSVLALIVSISRGGEAASRIRAGPNNRFYDDTGRVVVLRGFNLAGRVKTPPFTPFKDLSTMDSLASLGANVARVPFIWEAYEPNRGHYNSTYLEYYRGVIEHLHKMGILSIIDVHQDGISRYLNGDTRVSYLLPANGEDCKSWKFSLLLDNLVSGTWQAFYANENGTRDAFLSMWGSLAGNPAVLGYDILNEPFGSERTQIGPLWEDAAKVIRTKDRDAIIFLTPLFTLGALHRSFCFVWGNSSMAEPTFGNYAVAVHWYPQTGIPGSATTAQQFGMWFKVVNPWGAPLFVGEFGFEPACVEPGNPSVIALLLQIDDENARTKSPSPLGRSGRGHNAWDNKVLDGWNMEDYSIVDEYQDLRPNFAIRPYPRAIAGVPIFFQDTGFKICGKTPGLKNNHSSRVPEAHQRGKHTEFNAETVNKMIMLNTNGPARNSVYMLGSPCILVKIGNVNAKSKTMALSWNVTAEALSRNRNTTVYAPARTFFRVLDPALLSITTRDPDGATFPCSYVHVVQATIIKCIPTKKGVHSLTVAARAGLPAFFAEQAKS
eukprot:jgi/Botrbrau1/2308/Bobra.101_2s0129.1